jgi:hypothetical protein
MSTALERHLNELTAAKAKCDKELAQIEELRKKFPDLDVAVDRWRHTRFMSEQVNTVADQVEIRHNCGCCNDSPLEARPYVTIDGVNIYSKPDCFTVGEADPYRGGERAYADWQQQLIDKHINQAAIDIIKKYYILGVYGSTHFDADLFMFLNEPPEEWIDADPVCDRCIQKVIDQGLVEKIDGEFPFGPPWADAGIDDGIDEDLN